jgi:hypothetical protein
MVGDAGYVVIDLLKFHLDAVGAAFQSGVAGLQFRAQLCDLC